MKSLLTSATAVAVLALAVPAWAATDTACWNRTVERIDHYINPPERGDNQFFTAAASTTETTNVALLYPAKASMKGFAHRMYSIRNREGGTKPTGCTNAYLNGLKYFMPKDVTPPAAPASLAGTFYSSSVQYPDPGPTYAGGGGQSDGLVPGKVYRFKDWPANGGGTAEDAKNACQAVLDKYNMGNDVQSCMDCLASSGYWLNPYSAGNDNSSNSGIFTTNFLRFHPPRWTLLSLAYKRLINGPLLASLREGVIATNDTQGGTLLQMMLPQSCAGEGRPLNQKQGAIDKLGYSSNANPLAEMLLNAAWYMGGQENPWQFDSTAVPGSSAWGNKSGPCTNCKGDFLVLFSDGRGDEGNPNCAATSTSAAKAACTAVATQCTTGITLPSTFGLGAENDGNDFFGTTGSSTSALSKIPRVYNSLTCNEDLADDVAKWMYENPVKASVPNSKIKTYVVAIGDPDSPYGELDTLRAIAAVSGQGTPVIADNFGKLERELEGIIKEIISNNTSFSSAALTSVQTRGYTSAFIPRFKPEAGSQWGGTLSRFKLFNEFADGCTSADYNKKTAHNPNGDASCTDVYLRDLNNNFVGESAGKFVQLDDSKPWAGGWTPKTPEVLATPVWEASQKLTERVNQVLVDQRADPSRTSASARTIYTVVAKGDGSYDTVLVPFDVANADKIAPMMRLGGATGSLCMTLAGYTRSTYATEADCAKDIIRFLHGEDRLLQNPDNRPPKLVVSSGGVPQLVPRLNILGDIFHSTPVLVTAPTPTFLCDTGIANQCVASLYGEKLTPGGDAAYRAYATALQKRQQIVLVASNDGMLHAFNAGTYKEKSGTTPAGYDDGDGKELWAFVPPETLPKLIRYVVGERHEVLVDGTPMVRDIWVDGSGKTNEDYAKQADEFHTVAIVGKREGGRAYFALDVTDVLNPRFLWASSAAGTTDGLTAGESWNDLGPGAPPIGPIAEKDDNGKFSVGGVKSRERYVIAVGGGYDAAFLRGRAINVFDAWTGKPLYRFAHADAPTASEDPRSKLFPVAAPVSLVDSNDDQLFDLAIVGDTAGQLWSLDLSAAGQDADSDGRYDNWYGARAFVQFKAGSFASRSPFFQRAVVAKLPSGELRAYLGAGDRDNIKEASVINEDIDGDCGLHNLMACLRKDCDVTVTSTQYRVGPTPQGSSSGHKITGSWSYKAGDSAPVSSLAFTNLSQQVSCSDAADVKLDYSISCGGGSQVLSSTSPLYCDWGATSSTEECPNNLGRSFGANVRYTKAVVASRFYSVKLFDDGTRKRFASQTAAKTYDDAALTDADLVNADTTAAGTSGNGWYVIHKAVSTSNDEKTASSAVLLNGCVLWNTLNPNTQNEVSCSATTLPMDTAYLYQADAITGAIKCGSAGASTYNATVRYVSRDTYIAPQQPSPVVSVNSATGEIVYSSISLDPGSPPSSTTVGGGNIMGPIHWLEVPRSVHDCRHNGTNCTQ